MQVFDGLHAFLWESMTANNCNTYLIDGPQRVLIDPGHLAHFEHVADGLDACGVKISDVDLVVCTHCHPDHLEGARLFKKQPAQLALGKTELQFLLGMSPPVLAAIGVAPDAIMPDIFLKEGPLDIQGTAFEVFHTPGHSPGSICLYWPDKKALFTGDLIFAEGLGRVDLPGGDSRQIKQSIGRMKELDVAYILPGHGEIVSGEAAVQKTFENLETVWLKYI